MTLKFENHFADYGHFCGVLIKESFELIGLNDELDHIVEIEYESDPSRRIFVQTETDNYMIRTWNIYDDEDDVVVEYTIYIEDSNGEYQSI